MALLSDWSESHYFKYWRQLSLGKEKFYLAQSLVYFNPKRGGAFSVVSGEMAYHGGSTNGNKVLEPEQRKKDCSCLHCLKGLCYQ